MSAGTTFENLGNGGSDTTNGEDGNCYGLNSSSGNGGGGLLGGIRGGGGAGGNSTGSESGGGGGGGISGQNGYHSQGVVPPGGEVTPSGGLGGDGGGGGGGSVVAINTNNGFDGRANNGGYGGGGGGGAGLGGSSGIGSGSGQYSVAGGSGGTGGGGGGGGVGDNQTPSNGGNSSGGGGGGSGPTNGGSITPGGTDIGHLGGGTGGSGATDISPTAGGGGGGGGSGLGGAIFIDSTVSLNIQARSDNPTVFNTTNCTVQQGNGGTGWDNSDSNGTSGSSLGNSIFLRSGSSLVLTASGLNDILTLGSDVSFTDDTSFGEGNTNILVQGAGTVIYTGTSDYEGTIIINNANFQVQGLIDNANIQICRNTSINERRGMLSGTGTLTGFVYVQSGMIAPNAGSTLTLGSLQLNSAIPNSTLGSLVAISIDANGSSLVAINGDAQLAGKLELNIEPDALVGTYTILTSPHITGTFDDMVIFTHQTPNYAVSYLPIENPTYVLFDFLGYSSLEPVSNLQGSQKKNNFGFEYELYNQLTWTASSSNNVAGYFIYRDAQKIATVDTSTLSYQDHNRQQGTSYTYAITTFDSEDNESSPATVTIS